MATFPDLSIQRDLRAYEVVGTARAIVKLIRNGYLDAAGAADLLSVDLDQYDAANAELQAWKFDESIGLNATIASTEKLVDAVFQQEQQARANMLVMEAR